MDTLLKTIPIFTAALAVIWGIYVFNKQQTFKRLQNLSQILQRFGDKKDLLDLFNLFDQSLEIDDQTKQIVYNNDYLNKIENENAEIKWKFLVLLEEVALYARSFEVDREYAVHLFQWHFYFVYNNPQTSKAFWANIGGVKEIDKHYWEYQKSFSVFCKPF